MLHVNEIPPFSVLFQPIDYSNKSTTLPMQLVGLLITSPINSTSFDITENVISCQSSNVKKAVSCNTNRFSCPHNGCRATFTRKASVKRHLRIHIENNKVYICFICQKRFRGPEYLNNHHHLSHS
eukprot:c21119_g1_i1.p1 GENE.c21119_g1_i1~~c21119_g1_i1.p1  ORF type:complete len:125 (-),score=17.21 c21119_g1_i1:30-404(-)